MKYGKSLFIFHRDLRLKDNTALFRAALESGSLAVCFIADPRQTHTHPYQSRRGLDFLLNSLQRLSGELEKLGAELWVLEGEASQAIREAIQAFRPEAVYWNEDYTPFARQRDAEISRCCASMGIAAHPCPDLLLHPPGEILKPDGKPYTLFTPYYQAALKLFLPSPAGMPSPGRWFRPGRGSRSRSILGRLEEHSLPSLETPGREGAMVRLKEALELSDYERSRDIPSLDGTTRLSVHLKFGTLSVREVFHEMKDSPGHAAILRQFYWRDFFTTIGALFPSVFGHEFKKDTRGLEWSDSEEDWKRWTEGGTGFPIVDAGMRQLAETGFMHNRARMIAASFLVKDLGQDWRKGEAFFARCLTDYDPCVNNGNWQWCASTGCDSQPYFRVFNPWLQQKRFDPDGAYIKRWVPELKDCPASQQHNPQGERPGYPEPVTEHTEAARQAKARYFRAKEFFRKGGEGKNEPT